MHLELEKNIFWQQNRKNCGDDASEGDVCVVCKFVLVVDYRVLYVN